VAVTLQMYARRKHWPLTHARVEVSGGDQQGSYVIERRVVLEGDLTDEQRARLLDIAGRCPVSKRLTNGVTIRSVA
jgi:putative redox protein